jgi:hypothetical protein
MNLNNKTTKQAVSPILIQGKDQNIRGKEKWIHELNHIINNSA